MAPGTNIGAATPISGTGQELGETLASKVENDAAALIRSIAQERGRNEEALEKTVLEAASYSANEALEFNAIDVIAEDLDDLLRAIDGRMISLPERDEAISLRTEGMELTRLEKTLLESFLEFLADPNVSFLLLTLGGLGLVVELFNPGLIIPGLIGVIFLILAFLAFGNLPVNWAAAAFIVLAIVLAVLETQVAGFGVLGVGSIICLALGGFLLFTQFGDVSPTLPRVVVNRWLLGGTVAIFGGSVLYLTWQVFQSRRRTREGERASVVGQQAVVTSTLNPSGIVRVGNETWTAVSDDGNVIEVGESVDITQANGLILTVSRRRERNNQRNR